MHEIHERLRGEFGFEPALDSPYKLCDYRPAYGAVFRDYLRDFDFWGHCDVDVIWGDFRRFTPDEVLANHDIFSTRKGRLAGHCTLYRNDEAINQLYRRHPLFENVARSNAHGSFDETMTWLVANSPTVRVHWPRFLLNFANPPNDRPSQLPQMLNKYVWEDGRLFELTAGHPQEILYLHFMTWKDSLSKCDFGYEADPAKFYISYTGITLRPVAEDPA